MEKPSDFMTSVNAKLDAHYAEMLEKMRPKTPWSRMYLLSKEVCDGCASLLQAVEFSQMLEPAKAVKCETRALTAMLSFINSAKEYVDACTSTITQSSDTDRRRNRNHGSGDTRNERETRNRSAERDENSTLGVECDEGRLDVGYDEHGCPRLIAQFVSDGEPTVPIGFSYDVAHAMHELLGEKLQEMRNDIGESN